MKDRNLIYYVLFAQVIILVLLTVMFLRTIKFRRFNYHKSEVKDNGQCSKDTCGAIDNVNDPAYNMQNIVKQSILLEEHIAEKNKYCISCIVKHFQHILGLVEEAVWMAGKDLHKYPYLSEGEDYYQSLFDTWIKNRNNDKIKLEVLNKLREKRRLLIDTYFLQ
jgi:hypothetical protein